MKNHPINRPASATHSITALFGLLAFVLSLAILKIYTPFAGNIVFSCLFVIACITTTIFFIDLFFNRVYLRASTGLNFQKSDPSWSRLRIKCLGLVGSLGFVILAYCLFPEYREGNTYANYFSMLKIIGLPALALGFAYFLWIDRYMVHPHDG